MLFVSWLLLLLLLLLPIKRNRYCYLQKVTFFAAPTVKWARCNNNEMQDYKKYTQNKYKNKIYNCKFHSNVYSKTRFVQNPNEPINKQSRKVLNAIVVQCFWRNRTAEQPSCITGAVKSPRADELQCFATAVVGVLFVFRRVAAAAAAATYSLVATQVHWSPSGAKAIELRSVALPAAQ